MQYCTVVNPKLAARIMEISILPQLHSELTHIIMGIGSCLPLRRGVLEGMFVSSPFLDAEYQGHKPPYQREKIRGIQGMIKREVIKKPLRETLLV